jgi:molybdate transport system substrate-binding protein
VLLDPQIRKVAIANPEHAPYGRAAVAALRREKLYDRVSSKFVLGENISQSSGASDAGEGKIWGRSRGKNIRPSNKLP